jgi:hypothetical protein
MANVILSISPEYFEVTITEEQGDGHPKRRVCALAQIFPGLLPQPGSLPSGVSA